MLKSRLLLKELRFTRYKLNYIVKLEQIKLSQLSGNDFVLAVVDGIGFKSDKYGFRYFNLEKKGIFKSGL